MLSNPSARIRCRNLTSRGQLTAWFHPACAHRADRYLRVQIALARCKLEPLAVLSALCGPSAEILSMNLHPLKELVPRQALLTTAERICITAVNQASLPTACVLSVSRWEST